MLGRLRSSRSRVISEAQCLQVRATKKSSRRALVAPMWLSCLLELLYGLHDFGRCERFRRMCLPIVIRDLRQLRRGYRMWVICGPPDWFFKEATSTLRSFGMYQMWVGSLPHSLRIRLQCDGVETPDSAGDGAVCPRLRFRVDCRRRR